MQQYGSASRAAQFAGLIAPYVLASLPLARMEAIISGQDYDPREGQIMNTMQGQVPPTVSYDFERRLSPWRRAGRGISIITLTVLLGCFTVFAATPVTITQARIRLLPGDLPLAGYFDLTNGTDRPLVLTGASSPAFQMVHMHRSMESGGISTMAPAERIEIKPGETVRFAPGGYHLMLMSRLKPLQAGQEVPIRLEFASGDSVQAMFVVEGIQAK